MELDLALSTLALTTLARNCSWNFFINVWYSWKVEASKIERIDWEYALGSERFCQVEVIWSVKCFLSRIWHQHIVLHTNGNEAPLSVISTGFDDCWIIISFWSSLLLEWVNANAGIVETHTLIDSLSFSSCVIGSCWMMDAVLFWRHSSLFRYWRWWDWTSHCGHDHSGYIRGPNIIHTELYGLFYVNICINISEMDQKTVFMGTKHNHN